jgi:hypothetical protein
VANHLRLKLTLELIRALVFIPPSRFNLKPSGPIQVSGELSLIHTENDWLGDSSKYFWDQKEIK